MTTQTDRIEKQILLRATAARVWRALRDSKEFGAWFGVTLSEPFTPGARMRGTITPTTVDAEVAKTQKAYEGASFEFTIEKLEHERLFSFCWHPFAVDPTVDYSAEPTTLVEFTLQAVPEGTRLTIVESGFDRVPIERRAKAFTMNEQGWTGVTKLLDKYVSG